MDLYSVEQVAEFLGLHVRTVRNYVRDGRLKAVRIGKQYRIAREDLATMTGRTASSFERGPAAGPRHVEVSSIVEIDAINPELATRITNGMMAAAKNRGNEDPLRVESIYNEERERLKLVLIGGLTTVTAFLKLVGVYLEE